MTKSELADRVASLEDELEAVRGQLLDVARELREERDRRVRAEYELTDERGKKQTLREHAEALENVILRAMREPRDD